MRVFFAIVLAAVLCAAGTPQAAHAQLLLSGVGAPPSAAGGAGGSPLVSFGLKGIFGDGTQPQALNHHQVVTPAAADFAIVAATTNASGAETVVFSGTSTALTLDASNAGAGKPLVRIWHGALASGDVGGNINSTFIGGDNVTLMEVVRGPVSYVVRQWATSTLGNDITFTGFTPAANSLGAVIFAFDDTAAGVGSVTASGGGTWSGRNETDGGGTTGFTNRGGKSLDNFSYSGGAVTVTGFNVAGSQGAYIVELLGP